MKTLNIQNNKLGPFTTVIINSDHYLCDDIVYPFTVVGEGGVVGEWEEISEPAKPDCPDKISMRQARLILLQENLLDYVESIISSSPRSVQIEWEYALYLERSNPTVLFLSSSLNLTDQKIDDLFYRASLL